MKTMVTLTHEEAQSYLAYALICETMEGAFWNSGRRRRLYSKTFTEAEQGQDELDWFACTSFAPRASGDESSHVVFCDMSFGNAFATTDVFVNPRKGIPFVQCSTENQLSGFRKADSHE